MQTTFTLDTSGGIQTCDGDSRVYWRDLSPFTQGYIGALLLALDEQRMAHYQDRRRRSLPEAVPIRPAFSWLAPETLARIIADCEAFSHPKIGAADWIVFDHATGGDFWRDRQGRQLTAHSNRRFPPLTVILGDDGKVRFA